MPTLPIYFEEIRRLMPYAPPLVMPEQVIALNLPDHIVVLKTVSGADPLVASHLIDGPAVAPAMLLTELVGQAGLLLSILRSDQSENDVAHKFGLVGRSKASFKSMARVGDTIRADVTLSNIAATSFLLDGQLSVDERRIGRVELIARVL